MFIRTRSGRYINRDYIVYISVEETRITDQGRKLEVYKVVAHLPAPMNPAVLGIFRQERDAFKTLDQIIEKIASGEQIVYVPTEF
ncbi:MAG: hypothetical protein N2Z40_02430 [Caldimicrobium sp.]|nr:hypothetical protein [Caldimicrobium sp.]MCX7613067.1 hypothetical protein [Caldimicrobium sp.]MDW8182782.1 hypothetical protein [Caldimicrobium sp.]